MTAPTPLRAAGRRVPPGAVPRVSVVIVDDSPTMRRLLAAALAEEPGVEVVGAARDAESAAEMIGAFDPDVVTLDVTLPGISGIDFLERIMAERPRPVVMVSSLTAEGAETTLTTLERGAVDVVEKPRSPESLPAFRAALRAKVRQAAAARPRRAPARAAAAPATVAAAVPARAVPPLAAPSRAASPRPAPDHAPPPSCAAQDRRVVAFGASTGGVTALGALLAGLPAAMPPVLIVQHMPDGYPERFAARLAAGLGRDVAQARWGETLAPGMIRLAPGGRHLAVAAQPTGLQTRLLDLPPVCGHRPSVDVLFDSVARACGPAAVGVVLTGMGRDGAIGLAAMHRAGAACLGQGRESCVVYGMPRAARELGAVDEEVELEALPARICQILNR